MHTSVLKSLKSFEHMLYSATANQRKPKTGKREFLRFQMVQSGKALSIVT